MNLNYRIAARVSASLAVGAVCALSVVACGGGGGSGYASQMAQQTIAGFADTALVSNKTGVVATTTTIDANLSNPWGLVTAPGLPFWIADNNSNVTSLYSGTGQVETNAVTGSNATAIAIPASTAGYRPTPQAKSTMASAVS
jgi:hypothetical protein